MLFDKVKSFSYLLFKVRLAGMFCLRWARCAYYNYKFQKTFTAVKIRGELLLHFYYKYAVCSPLSYKSSILCGSMEREWLMISCRYNHIVMAKSA